MGPVLAILQERQTDRQTHKQTKEERETNGGREREREIERERERLVACARACPCLVVDLERKRGVTCRWVWPRESHVRREMEGRAKMCGRKQWTHTPTSRYCRVARELSSVCVCGREEGWHRGEGGEAGGGGGEAGGGGGLLRRKHKWKGVRVWGWVGGAHMCVAGEGAYRQTKTNNLIVKRRWATRTRT